LVLDPFAGGSVRGVVAAKLGRRYVGVDLRREQCTANMQQASKILAGRFDDHLSWVCGDSRSVISKLDLGADLIFTCPPYGDLEVYSDLPGDLSGMDHANFKEAFAAIIKTSIGKLMDNRFAAIVVGDFRDQGGFYRGFVGETIAAFEAAGAKLYNEAILVTAAGSLPIRAGKQFAATRKLGKTHQNVLIFCKGNPAKATEACGTVEVDEALFAEEFGELL
jgi:hypothetical protein